MDPSETNNVCHTRCAIRSTSFTWIIHQFSACVLETPNGKCIESRQFKLSKTSWKLKLFPNGSDSANVGLVSLVCALESEIWLERLLITVSILRRDSLPLVLFEETEILGSSVQTQDLSEFGFANQTPSTKSRNVCCKQLIRLKALLQNAEEFLPDDKLTVVYKVTVSSILTNSTVHFIPPCTMANDVNSLLESGELSDVTILVDGKSFRAHKAILAARSPVFAAMFKHPVEENLIAEVIVTDIDSEAIEALLKYIYSGTCTNIKGYAEKLLIAADKYGLERLKVICEVELCSNLSVETVIQLFCLADKYYAKYLKQHAKEYFVKNAKSVVLSKKWKELSEDNELIITELLETSIVSRDQ